MTEYLKIVPLPSWWQKLELNDLSIYELFKELLSQLLPDILLAPILVLLLQSLILVFSLFSLCNLFSNP